MADDANYGAAVTIDTSGGVVGLDQLGGSADKAQASLDRIATATESMVSKLRPAQDEAKRTADALESLKSSGESLKKMLEFAGVTVGLKEIFDQIYDATTMAQYAQVGLASAVAATKGAAGLSTEQLAAYAEQISNVSTASVTQIKQAELIDLTYTHLSGTTFKRVIADATDLAAKMSMAGMFTDPASAARMLGRALESPAAGMMLLRRAGIVLQDSEKEQIKTLAEHGHTAEAMALMLTKVEASSKGAALAMRDTLGGSVQVLKNEFEELFIAIGTQFAPMIRDLAAKLGEAIKTPEFRQFAVDLGQGVGGAIKLVAGGADFLVQHLELVKEVIGAIIILKAASWLNTLAASEALASLAAIDLGESFAAMKVLGFAEGLQYLGLQIGGVGAALKTAAAEFLAANGPLVLLVIAIGAVAYAIRQYTAEQERQNLEMRRQLSVEAEARGALVELGEATRAITQDMKDRAQAAGTALVAELALAQADLAHAKQIAGQNLFSPADTAKAKQDVQDAAGRVGELQRQVKTLGDEYIRVSKLPLVGDKQKDDVAQLAKDQKKAEEHVAEQIAVLKQKAESEGRVAQAALSGAAAVQKQKDVETANLQVLRLRQELEKVQLSLSPAQEQAIRKWIAAETAAKELTATRLAQEAFRIAQQSELAKGEAALRDAAVGGDAATRLQAASEAAVKEAIAQKINVSATATQQDKDALEVIRQKTIGVSDQVKAWELLGAALVQQRQWDLDLQAAQAGLTDAQAQGGAATRDAAEASLAYSIIMQRKVALEGEDADAIRRDVHEFLAKKQALLDETAQTERLIAARRELEGIRAQLSDWEAQTAAANKYGSQVAGILQQYGLLSKATEELTIKQEILDAIKKEGAEIDLKQNDAFNARQINRQAQIEEEIRGQHRAVDAIKEVQAQEALAANAVQPIRDAWTGLWTQLEDQIAQGKLDWQSLWDTFRVAMIKAIEEMVVRWIQAEIAMAAADRARQAASGGGGFSMGYDPSSGGVTGLGGGGAGWAGLIGSSGTAGVAGSGSGAAGLFSGTGALGATGMVFAWAAALAVFAIAINKLNDHMQKTEENVITLNQTLDIATPVSGSGSRIAALEATGKQLAYQIQQFFITYDGIFTSLDAAIGVKRRGRGGDTEWKVYVDGIVTNFGKDMQAALDFAAIEAVKHSSSLGLDPLVAAAIKDYAGKSAAEFKAQVDFAQRIATQNLPGISGQLSAASQQYFADLHQAQVQFASDLPALNAAVESIIQKFNDTVQGLKDSALGVSTGTADFLAGLVAFQQGIDHTSQQIATQLQQQIAKLNDQITGIGPGPKGKPGQGVDDVSQEEAAWQSRVDDLKKAVKQYQDQLDKIPKALTDSEVSMAIFDSLYKYLQGSGKYAAQAAEYAKMKVDIEFEAIKLQIIALNKWEEFAAMWTDALAAAEGAAIAQATARPGGSGAADARKQFDQQLKDLAAQGLSPAAKALYDYQKQLRDLAEQQKKDKAPAADYAAAIAAVTAAFKKGLLDTAQGYAGIGDAFTKRLQEGSQFFKDLETMGRKKSGIPDWLERVMKGEFLDQMKADWQSRVDAFRGVTNPMLAIQAQAKVLSDQLSALAAATGMSAAQIATAKDEIAQGIEYQKQQGINGILDKLFGYLQGSAKWASDAVKLKQEEVQLEFVIYRAQLASYGVLAQYAGLLDDAEKAAMDAAASKTTNASTVLSSWIAASNAATATSATASSLVTAIQGLEAYQQSLRTTPSMGLVNSREALANAQVAYEAIRSQALGGNLDAISGFQKAAEAYRTNLVAFSPSSQLTAQVVGGIDATLAQIIGKYGAPEDPVVAGLANVVQAIDGAGGAWAVPMANLATATTANTTQQATQFNQTQANAQAALEQQREMNQKQAAAADSLKGLWTAVDNLSTALQAWRNEARGKTDEVTGNQKEEILVIEKLTSALNRTGGPFK